jgi:DNA-binding transcriptional ArsR family regulator
MTGRSPRRAALAHEARLDILCCLDPEEPLKAEQIGTSTGLDSRLAGYHLRILDRLRFVRRERQRGESGPTSQGNRVPPKRDLNGSLI